jgi:hypothetical protein
LVYGAEARTYLAAGDARLAANDPIGALDNYQRAYMIAQEVLARR